MTTYSRHYTQSEAFYPSSDALWRATGTAIYDALNGCGMTRTTDTGQVDWATATRPTNILTYPYYDIWKFTDSVNTQYPIVLKIEYGSTYAYQTGVPPLHLRLSVGSGSNGSGQISTLLSEVVCGSAATNHAAYNPGVRVLACHTSGAMWFGIINTLASTPYYYSQGVQLFGIFRSQNQTTGAYTSNFTMINGFMASTGSAAPTYYINPSAYSVTRSSSFVRSTTDFGYMPYPAQRSGRQSGRYVSPAVFLYDKFERSDRMMLYRSGEFPTFGTFQAAPVFDTRTYIAMPTYGVNSNGNYYHALPWE